MVTLEEKANVSLLSSDGSVVSCGNLVMISADISRDAEDTEVKIRGTRNSLSITSENCILDKRTVDYICGFLSLAEYKMPKKKHRKSARIKKRLKKTQGIVLRMER